MQGSLPPSRSLVREFWVLVAKGVPASEAGIWVGVSQTSGLNWFRQAGGVRPQLRCANRSGRRPRLTFEDRVEIEIGVRTKESLHSIGIRLGRPASTVKREIDANGGHSNVAKSGYRRKEAFGARQSGNCAQVRYRAVLAQQRSDQRACRTKPTKLASNDRLRNEVQNRLTANHSPEQIEGGLRLEFPDDPEMWVSDETIYKAIYLQGRGGLRRELHRCLRTGRALRKPQRSVVQRRRIPDMVNIAERPPEVEDRAVPGHWEGDLIIGANQASAIGTLVERISGFVQLLHLPNDHTAESVAAQVILKMTALPDTLRRTLTWDQGSEMANHAQISAAAELQVYFCDPHSPWQRGTNENTNGLLRQYFPKGTDLSVYPADYLDYVALQLNTRPRQRHGFKTPAQILDEILSNPPTVASTA